MCKIYGSNFFWGGGIPAAPGIRTATEAQQILVCRRGGRLRRCIPPSFSSSSSTLSGALPHPAQMEPASHDRRHNSPVPEQPALKTRRCEASLPRQRRRGVGGGEILRFLIVRRAKHNGARLRAPASETSVTLWIVCKSHSLRLPLTGAACKCPLGKIFTHFRRRCAAAVARDYRYALFRCPRRAVSMGPRHTRGIPIETRRQRPQR